MRDGSWRQRLAQIAMFLVALVAGADLAAGRAGAGAVLIGAGVLLAAATFPERPDGSR